VGVVVVVAAAGVCFLLVKVGKEQPDYFDV
jgi:hypothetical protein